MDESQAPRVTRIATAVPGEPHDQLGIAERMAVLHGMDTRGARRLRAYHHRTRIASRHSVLAHDWTRADGRAFFRPGVSPSTGARMKVFAQEAPRLAERAAAGIFERTAKAPGPADTRPPHPEEIDHLIVVSCTGFLAPGLDVSLVRRLGLRADVGRTLIGFQGCHAGLSALRLAHDITTADPRRSVLIVAVELSTLHFQYEATPENLLANALFADGAAAVLVDGAAVERPSGSAFRLASVETRLLPEGGDDMRWSVGDRGFTLDLSDRLPDLIARHVCAIDAGCASPSAWAVHPGGAAILDAVEGALGLNADALGDARATLRRYGNLSSATIFFVLARMQRTGLPADRRVVALAFGPGLTIEIARLSTPTRGNEDGEAWRSGPISRHAATSRS